MRVDTKYKSIVEDWVENIESNMEMEFEQEFF